MELRDGIPYAGFYPLPDGDIATPSGSFIPANTTPVPETVFGPLPSWAKDPDMSKLKEKGKSVWQNVKRRLSKSDQGGRK